MNKSESQFILALSTIDSEKEGLKIARALVESKLAACVNIVPKVRSVYEWEGKIAEEEEFLLIIKTTENQKEGLKEILAELHPYEVPELIFLPITDGLPDYFDWILKNTGSSPK